MPADSSTGGMTRTLAGVRRPWCTRRRSAARRSRFSSLPRGQVEGGVEVGAVGLGPDDRALAAEGDLHALAVGGLAGVLLVEQLHIHAEHLQLAVEAFELTDLVLDVLAVVLRNLDVATTDHDLHETSRLDGL